MLRLLACLAILIASPAAAQPIRNLGSAPAPLRSGPDAFGPVVGELAPGAPAEVTRCDWSGRWCLVSTDREVGWLDMELLPSSQSAGAGVRPLPLPGEIEVTPLPGESGVGLDPEATPLPRAILDAVPPGAASRLDPVAGTRPPLLLSMTRPMRNVTDGIVNLRAGPGTDHAVIGQLDPGEGGPIETCNATEQWCLIRTPDGPGWVKMTLVGAARHVITAR
ncbi:SH3 domain-containing protein [Jannaschia formosa]|uniref:SH3 domain-containing protein n=1 Tax=Jannaschia formosa TaxID=2259592 RepID=UPI000E1B7AC9|nr:SH3 domain-containing protein [Jannaschia formosa]TFL20237.1 hypothetical protein DR046_02540 [Jannaschia formosa]